MIPDEIELAFASMMARALYNALTDDGQERAAAHYARYGLLPADLMEILHSKDRKAQAEPDDEELRALLMGE